MAKRSAIPRIMAQQLARLESDQLFAVRRKMALCDWHLRMTFDEADVLRDWFRAVYDAWREQDGKKA